MESSDLRSELKRRSARDQDARHAVEGWSDEPRTELWNAISEVDADNTQWLVDLVTRHGRPLQSEVGEEAATDAWLLAQVRHEAPFVRVEVRDHHCRPVAAGG